MEKSEKIFLVISAIIIAAMLCFAVLKKLTPAIDAPDSLKPISIEKLRHKILDREKPKENSEEQNPQDNPEQTPQTKPDAPKAKVYINVFFIGQNDSKEEVYKAVKREYDKDLDGSQLKFAIKALVAGPRPNELGKGVYSEIPSTTYVISVSEQPDRVTINLNSGFTSGGGTDSLYKRLYQLIKTAKNNTNKPVYLQINGKQADVIGGEGIMLTQPLTEGSLGG